MLATIPVADATELDEKWTPLSAPGLRASDRGDDDARPALEAQENDTINAALRKAVEMFPTINDMLVHEGGTIWFKSARRTQRVADLFKIAGTPLAGGVTGKMISYFLLVHVMGARSTEQAETIWQRVRGEIKQRGSFSESIRLGWGVKARVQLFQHGKGRWALNVRVSRSIPPALDQIGLPPQVVPTIKGATRGLILLTGPMSSGKTTTAQALLQHHNMMRSGHIVTIEDPIETDLVPGRCLITAKEVGVDCTSFSQGLLDALRQAVDVLLIGELRDAETIRVALAAAASGILVIATTHGDTTTGTLSKMMTLLGSEAPGYYKILGQNLVCVIRQAMVPSKGGDRWITVADALMPSEGSELSAMLGEGKISAIESKILSAPSTPARPGAPAEWVSMNDRLAQLVRAGEVDLSQARMGSSHPKGLAC